MIARDHKTAPLQATKSSGNSAAGVPEKSEIKRIYLHAGITYASREPASLSIIVGSCVAVCAYDRRLSIGGATHYLLPNSEGRPSTRSGEIAILLLLHELRQAGSQDADLRAEIYGGARLLAGSQSGSAPQVGERNVQLAQETLSRESIAIARIETGGNLGRKVSMRTDTGEISFRVIGN
jgi:chemotaxis protein CheD